jgi:hypothetical protein
MALRKQRLKSYENLGFDGLTLDLGTRNRDWLAARFSELRRTLVRVCRLSALQLEFFEEFWMTSETCQAQRFSAAD